MIFMFLSHMELLRTVCAIWIRNLPWNILKKHFYILCGMQKKTPPDFKCNFNFQFPYLWIPFPPPFTKQQMFYYSAPQAIVTCVLSITKGFCLKRLDLSHVFACETAVHLGHILGCLKMCNFQVFVLTLFESCVTAANRRKKLSCLCICKHHRTMAANRHLKKASGNAMVRIFGLKQKKPFWKKTEVIKCKGQWSRTQYNTGREIIRKNLLENFNT